MRRLLRLLRELLTPPEVREPVPVRVRRHR
jgi:hypothetical protein